MISGGNDSKGLTACGRRTKTKKRSFSDSNSPSIDLNFNSSKSRNDQCDWTGTNWTDEIPGCPVYHPSIKEFEDPLMYLQKIVADGSKYGICKIVSPLKASVPAAEVLKDLEFTTFVQPLHLVKCNTDKKVIFSRGQRKYTFGTFRTMADKESVCHLPYPASLSFQHLEKKFWQEMSSGRDRKVEYALNVDGSAFSSDPTDLLGTSKWNLQTLPKLPTSLLRLVEHEIPGITSPMLYIGMLFSMFAWHVEDHYLYSINYHHTGAPKTWYGVPGHSALQLEGVVLDHVYPHNILSTQDVDGAFKEIAGKTTMFSPEILLKNGVPVYKALQMPGEFVITFPRAYHAGFSNGFNCGEAVNFAISDWLPFGALASKRYAFLGIMPILPYEEVLCKEAVHLVKAEGSDLSSAEAMSQLSIKSSFAKHMRLFNNALWNLKKNIKALTTQSMILPNSHRTIICSACKRDSYLAFLECHRCYQAHCLFHDDKKNNSLHCPCGSKKILYVSGDIWDVEEIAQRLDQGEFIQEVCQEMKADYYNCLLPSVISCIETEDAPHSKINLGTFDAIEQEEAAAASKTACDDPDMERGTKRRCPELKGIALFQTRRRCRLQKSRSKFRSSASEVSPSA